MPERLVADATVKTAQAAEKGVESLVKKAWSIMDAAAEKTTPSQYLSDQAVRSIQGKE
jgi:hypothetical protein